MNTKKGISPVIATVLLIVVALALFLLIFFWLRGFQKEAILKYGTPVETVCMGLNYDVVYSAGILQVKNTGSTTIYKATVFVGGSLNTTINQMMPASTGQASITCVSGKNIKVIPYLLGTTKSGTNKEYACTNQAKTIPC